MELLLDKKKCEYMKKIAQGSVIHEENTEIIVSDRSPDVVRIVRSFADVFVTDKEARDGKLSITGNVKGVVLYMAEGERCLRKIDVSMPFFHVFDADGVTPDSKLAARIHLRSFEVREVNPRKLAVRANIDISYRAYERSERTICFDVCDGEEYGICVRHRDVYGYSPIMMRDKSFAVSDDIELSGEGMEMSSILLGTATLSQNETKIIGNKAVLKGIAEINYVYETENGTVNCDGYEMPFSQILDIEGMEESHELEIGLSVSGIDFDPQYDASGKARYMTVSITADALVTVYEKFEDKVIDDVYSTKFETDVKYNSLTSERYITREEKRVPVTETVQTGSGVKKVLDVSVSVFPPVRRREEEREFISSDASVTVMYIGEDDLIYSASRRVPVICPVELSENHTYEVSSKIRGKGYSVGTGNEINVRFFTDFAITETEVMTVSAISEISADTESLRHGEKAPGVTVKRVERECDVWSLAKEHGASVEEICIANNISDSDYIAEGRMILIPKHR
ncbi:MAG: DUF3794 domain-containing protein [Oscillospiraceae bacterium]|nr:DUF3794 domain-containing protein [Oscillospiraceae bacterium]